MKRDISLSLVKQQFAMENQPFRASKSTDSMAIVNNSVKLPEGYFMSNPPLFQSFCIVKSNRCSDKPKPLPMVILNIAMEAPIEIDYLY